MNVLTTIELVNNRTPYIQNIMLKNLGVKLKPVNNGAYFEVFLHGTKINDKYELKPYEYRQSWYVTE